MANRLRSLFPIIAFLLSLALSGCITAETSIVVQPDGSGELTTTVSIPIEFIAELTEQGIDVIKTIKQSVFEDLGYETWFEQWSEDDNEWLKLTRPFSNLNELNELARTQSFVDTFSFQRKQGFLKDLYTVDAQLTFTETDNPFYNEMHVGEVDAPDDIDIQLWTQLPGKIVNTNGDIDPLANSITWTLDQTHSLEIHALNESWNMLNIALAVFLGIVGIVLLAAIVVLILRNRRKKRIPVESLNVKQRLAESIPIAEEKKPLSDIDIEQPAVSPPSKILAMVGARSLLEQVNSHVLNNRGQIAVGKGAIRLVWTDQQNQSVTRSIMITVQDMETLLINGVPFPATREGAKEGLITCLRGMSKQ
jgi:hypothetical protein